MPSPRLTLTLLTTLFAFLVSSGTFAKEKSFQGTVTVTETRGDVATQFLFTRKGDKLRIEHTDKSKAEPVNIVDLAAQKLTIVYPHNSSFVEIDLTKADASPSAHNPPRGFPPPPPINQPARAARPGPANSPPPGFPTPPNVDSMPPLPNPAMAGPPMPGMARAAGPLELKKTDKTRNVQGFDCTLYTISDAMETLELWATNDAALFPLQPLRANYNRRFGPQMLEEQWIGLLQKQSLFPLEATLKARTGGPPQFSFKVEKIERKAIDDESLFKAPDGYYQIRTPQL